MDYLFESILWFDQILLILHKDSCFYNLYNVKLLFYDCSLFLSCYSEISKAQDRLTDLLQNIYTTHPQYQELLRMIMSTVGRGGEGDVGQRIRDEILVIQVIYLSLGHLHMILV